MSETNLTMPKKGSKKRDEPSDPYIQPIESEDKEGLSKEPPQDPRSLKKITRNLQGS